MRYLCLIYLDEKALAAMPEKDMNALNARHLELNDDLLDSGHFVEAEALQPASDSTCVRVRNGRTTLVDGPFAETKELVAGFWLWKVKSRQEAIDWAMKCPAPFNNQECEIELRQVFEAEDFGAELTPELRAKEEELRERAAKIG